MSHELATAIRIAATSHEPVLDMGGNAYILHPMRIMLRLRTDDHQLMAIAILHDVLEDDLKITIEYLREQGISERVIRALQLLTHRKDEKWKSLSEEDKEKDYQEYIQRIASNYDAVRVKLEDLKDNLDPTRLKGLREKDFTRMKKYTKAFKFLTAAKKSFEECFSR